MDDVAIKMAQSNRLLFEFVVFVIFVLFLFFKNNFERVFLDNCIQYFLKVHTSSACVVYILQKVNVRTLVI